MCCVAAESGAREMWQGTPGGDITGEVLVQGAVREDIIVGLLKRGLLVMK